MTATIPSIFHRPADSGLGRLAALCFAASGTAVFVSTAAGMPICTSRRGIHRLGSLPGVDVALCGDGSRGVADMARGWLESARQALGLFLLQWLLNALWTPLFFGMHRSGLAFAEIIMLWLVLAATLGLFWRVRKAAGALLMPYLAWVSFAAALNFTIWRLNPEI